MAAAPTRQNALALLFTCARPPAGDVAALYAKVCVLLANGYDLSDIWTLIDLRTVPQERVPFLPNTNVYDGRVANNYGIWRVSAQAAVNGMKKFVEQRATGRGQKFQRIEVVQSDHAWDGIGAGDGFLTLVEVARFLVWLLRYAQTLSLELDSCHSGVIGAVSFAVFCLVGCADGVLLRTSTSPPGNAAPTTSSPSRGAQLEAAAIVAQLVKDGDVELSAKQLAVVGELTRTVEQHVERLEAISSRADWERECEALRLIDGAGESRTLVSAVEKTAARLDVEVPGWAVARKARDQLSYTYGTARLEEDGKSFQGTVYSYSCVELQRPGADSIAQFTERERSHQLGEARPHAFGTLATLARPVAEFYGLRNLDPLLFPVEVKAIGGRMRIVMKDERQSGQALTGQALQASSGEEGEFVELNRLAEAFALPQRVKSFEELPVFTASAPETDLAFRWLENVGLCGRMIYAVPFVVSVLRRVGEAEFLQRTGLKP